MSARGELERLICAVQFLTRLPTPRLTNPPADAVGLSARYFPVAGQLVGLICGGVLIAAAQVWNGWLPALLAVAAGVLATGALHEDGLADTADGLGGGRTPARRLAIMKDSAIGVFGVLTLGLTLAAKIGALASLSPWQAAGALVVAHGLARAADLGQPGHQAVQRAAHRATTHAQHMRVDHRRPHVLVSHQLLNGADVRARRQQMRREAVPERMARRPLADLRLAHRVRDFPLQHALVQMMPAALAGGRVAVRPGGREDPLPRPTPGRAIAELPAQRVG